MNASGQGRLVGVSQTTVVRIEPFDRDFERKTGIEAGRSLIGLSEALRLPASAGAMLIAWITNGTAT